jgi:hypothetical protein
LHPILAGHGDPQSLIFRDGSNVPLEVAQTTPLSTGVIILTYRPAPGPPSV